MERTERRVGLPKGRRSDLLFCLPVALGMAFVCGGVGLLVHVAGCWRTYLSARSWAAVPARIEELEFNTEPASDGQVYSVTVTYSYEFGGQTYTGHRVDIMGGSSSDYDLHRRRYVELARHRDRNIPFQAYVNPRTPREAVLYREPDAWMYAGVLMAVLFSGAGLACVALGLVALGRRKRLREIAEGGGGRKWHLRKDWRAGRIRASSVREVLLAWLLGLGLATFASMFIVLTADQGAPVVVWLFVGALALGGVLLVLRAVLLTLRQAVFGMPVLYLSEVPVVPGRPVAAAVRTAKPLQADRWRFVLECCVPLASEGDRERAARVERVVRQLEGLPGKKLGVRPTTWYGQRAYRLELAPAGDARIDRTGRALAPVILQVPEGAPEACLDPAFAVNWILAAEAASFPFRLKARFVLPVFYAAPEEIEPKAGEFGQP